MSRDAERWTIFAPIEALSRRHNRTGYTCGVATLNEYPRTQASRSTCRA
jgi:hypothetical protein